MNILITLPKHLIDSIIRGEKQFEMRKVCPRWMKIGKDGFFAVEKGTSNVRCWCRVDNVIETDITYYSKKLLATQLFVSEDYIDNYANSKKVYLWEIGKVIELSDLDRGSLFINKNPQQFAYCPFSDGESY